MNYELDVDYGRPYTEKVGSKRALKRKLRKLKKFYEREVDLGNDFAYFDVNVRRVK